MGDIGRVQTSVPSGLNNRPPKVWLTRDLHTKSCDVKHTLLEVLKSFLN